LEEVSSLRNGSSTFDSPEWSSHRLPRWRWWPPSAPRSTKLISPERRPCDHVERPAVLLAVDHHLLVFLDELEVLDARCRREACQGSPFFELATTSRAAAVSRDIAVPLPTSCPGSMRIAVGVPDT
jgi:hypothetical protein